MFIRETKVKQKSGKVVTYLQICESYRKRGKRYPCTKVIMGLGRKEDIDRKKIESLIRVLNGLISERKKEDEINILETRAFGIPYIVEKLFERTGISRTIRKALKEMGYESPVEKAVMAMVINRMMDPMSKMSAYYWADKNIYLSGKERLELQHYYRGIDFIYRIWDRIEKSMYWATSNLLNLEMDIIFYDTTTVSFEVEEEDELRKRGRNKEGRRDVVQVLLGLAVNQDGFPIKSWVFEGNRNDSKTIDEVINGLKGFSIREVIFISDRGVMSKKNIIYLEEKGIPYVLGMPLKIGSAIRKAVLSGAGDYVRLASNLFVKDIFIGGERYIVCFNPSEGERKKRILHETIKEIRGELERRDHKTKKILGIYSDRKRGKFLKKGSNGGFEINEDVVEEEEKLCGVYVITTNNMELEKGKLVRGYKNMSMIESSFRYLKSFIDISPVYHWTEERIKGHIYLCVLSYFFERWIEKCGDATFFIAKEWLMPLNVVKYEASLGRVVQRVELNDSQIDLFKNLGIGIPPKNIAVEPL